MKNNKGITMTSLVVTIVVLLILSTITIQISMRLIERADIENLKTNMLLLQAEAKSSAEDFNFKKYGLDTGAGDYETQLNNLKESLIGNKIENATVSSKIEATLRNTGIAEGDISSALENCYYLNQEDLNNININAKVRNEEYYVIKYDFDNLKAEIYYTEGYDYKDQTYYSLTQLENINS